MIHNEGELVKLVEDTNRSLNEIGAPIGGALAGLQKLGTGIKNATSTGVGTVGKALKSLPTGIPNPTKLPTFVPKIPGPSPALAVTPPSSSATNFLNTSQAKRFIQKTSPATAIDKTPIIPRPTTSVATPASTPTPPVPTIAPNPTRMDTPSVTRPSTPTYGVGPQPPSTPQRTPANLEFSRASGDPELSTLAQRTLRVTPTKLGSSVVASAPVAPTAIAAPAAAPTGPSYMDRFRGVVQRHPATAVGAAAVGGGLAGAALSRKRRRP